MEIQKTRPVFPPIPSGPDKGAQPIAGGVSDTPDRFETGERPSVPKLDGAPSHRTLNFLGLDLSEVDGPSLHHDGEMALALQHPVFDLAPSKPLLPEDKAFLFNCLSQR